MAAHVDVPDRPTCPVCAVPVAGNGSQWGRQQFRCGSCGATGYRETFHNNALRRAGLEPVEEPTAPGACFVCGQPARSDRLCASCAATLGNARHAARLLSDAEKRRRAQAAVSALMKHGYVGVRLVNA